jgi:hypothetical protein
MGPFQRQALRVLHAGKVMGFERMTAGLIATILTENGVTVRPSQITAALAGTASARRGGWTKRHTRTYLKASRPHNLDNPGYFNCEVTLGWSITTAGIDAIDRHPLHRLGGTKGYCYHPREKAQ